MVSVSFASMMFLIVWFTELSFMIVWKFWITSAGTSIVVTVPSSEVYVYVPLLLSARVVTVWFAAMSCAMSSVVVWPSSSL
ncbi:hypothetical protein D3C86_1305490 [compost metagenome]